jgi:putative ABC transport system ATP-binding protein
VPETVQLQGLWVGFGKGAARVEALRGIDVGFETGGMTLVTGSSGSGKTTLLSAVGGILRADVGHVIVAGTDITGFDDDQLATFRRERVGFVFQAFRLIKSLSAAENIAISLHLRFGGERSALLRRAGEALGSVGLAAKARLRPDALSGGEKQRVAIARALAHAPSLVLADEPTASLDAENGLHTLALLRDVACIPGRTVIVVSHDDRAKAFANRVVRIEDGRVVGGGIQR